MRRLLVACTLVPLVSVGLAAELVFLQMPLNPEQVPLERRRGGVGEVVRQHILSERLDLRSLGGKV